MSERALFTEPEFPGEDQAWSDFGPGDQLYDCFWVLPPGVQVAPFDPPLVLRCSLCTRRGNGSFWGGGYHRLWPRLGVSLAPDGVTSALDAPAVRSLARELWRLSFAEATSVGVGRADLSSLRRMFDAYAAADAQLVSC